MNKITRVLSAIITLAIYASAFVGCSQTSISKGSDKNVEEDTAQTVTENQRKNITLHYISHDNTLNRELKRLAPDFEKQTGIKVEIEPVGQQIFEQRIALDFAGATGSIDAIYYPAPYVQKWAKANWVKPLDEFIKKDEQKINMNDFVASTVESMKVDGKLYGLPILAEVGLMAYRKDILSKYGFNEPPKTWDELLMVAEKIKASDSSIAPFVARAQKGQGINMFIFPMFMWGYGGSFYKDYPKDMTPVLDRPENIKALEVYSTLINKYGPKGGSNFSYPEVTSAMQSGQAAITIDGTSVVVPLLDPAKNKFAKQTALAMVPSGPYSVSPANAVHGIAVSRFTKYPEETWQFIMWATSTATLKKMALGTENYNDYTRESVANDREVLYKYNKGNFAKLRMEALKAARGDFRPLTPEWAEIGDTIATQVNYVTSGTKDAKTALIEANKEVTEMVKEGGYIK